MHVFGPRTVVNDEILRNLSTGHSVTDREAKEFLERGFFYGQDMVEVDLLQRARSYINEQYKAWLKMSVRQDDWRIQLLVDLHKLDEPVEHGPIMDVLLQSPKLLAHLEALMGSKPAGIFYNQVAYRTPLINPTPKIMEYTVGSEYHIDGQANNLGTRFPDPWTVLVGVALVDIQTTDMGNFTVFPGTHASVDWCNYPAEKRAKTLPSLGEPFKVCLKAGDVVFAHVLLPHRGGKNILTENDVERLGLNYEGLPNIPKATREMIFFRIRAEDIDYNSPVRSESILKNPFHEHVHLVEQVKRAQI